MNGALHNALVVILPDGGRCSWWVASVLVPHHQRNHPHPHHHPLQGVQCSSTSWNLYQSRLPPDITLRNMIGRAEKYNVGHQREDHDPSDADTWFLLPGEIRNSLLHSASSLDHSLYLYEGSLFCQVRSITASCILGCIRWILIMPAGIRISLHASSLDHPTPSAKCTVQNV